MAGDTARGKLLRQVDGLIDFEALRPLLGGQYAEPERGGKPGYDPVLLFKLLLLERWFNLSDREVVQEAEDRLSFLQFLGVAPGAGLPADNTLVDFRARQERAGGLGQVFDAVNGQLAAQGLLLQHGAIKVVDATLIAAQTRPGGKDQQGKPLEPEASYARRKHQTHFGYKAHMGLDGRTDLVHRVCVTPANVHDSQVFTPLLDAQDAAVTADKAYDSAAHDRHLAQRDIANGVLYRARRHRPLTAAQRAHNRAWSRIRGSIERKFGEMKRWHRMARALYRGRYAVEMQVHLTAIVVNLKRGLVLQG
ncbi:MAG TPA: IS5 family transposase [bacterium]|nr:IS5 family transposase [bacterium]